MSTILHQTPTFQLELDAVPDADNKNDKEMALGIRSRRFNRNKVFAIALSSAWKYNEPDYMEEAAVFIAQYLGMFPDKLVCQAITNLVLNFLPDLIASKPYQDTRVSREIGEARITINDDLTINFGITNTDEILH